MGRSGEGSALAWGPVGSQPCIWGGEGCLSPEGKQRAAVSSSQLRAGLYSWEAISGILVLSAKFQLHALLGWPLDPSPFFEHQVPHPVPCAPGLSPALPASSFCLASRLHFARRLENQTWGGGRGLRLPAPTPGSAPAPWHPLSPGTRALHIPPGMGTGTDMDVGRGRGLILSLLHLIRLQARARLLDASPARGMGDTCVHVCALPRRARAALPRQRGRLAAVTAWGTELAGDGQRLGGEGAATNR